MGERNIVGADAGQKKARGDFIAALKTLVVETAKKEGVVAAFACHDGLLIERSGKAEDFDTLATSGQNLVYDGKQVLEHLRFGHLSQLALVSDNMKLAFFVVKQVAIGVAAERRTDLNAALS